MRHSVIFLTSTTVLFFRLYISTQLQVHEKNQISVKRICIFYKYTIHNPWGAGVIAVHHELKCLSLTQKYRETQSCGFVCVFFKMILKAVEER